MKEKIEKWIKDSERKIEIAQKDLQSCIAQNMSDGALNNIQFGIQRETGKLNAYKGCYLLACSYERSVH